MGIGHNPGAMLPTLIAAKKFNCKAGFDVEDYHSEEGMDKKLQMLTKKLMVNLLPQFNYVSFAAPLILEQVKVDVVIESAPWFTVLNYFSKSEFYEPLNLGIGPVKMVWFSQNINAGRGLELILPFVKQNCFTVELHLIGNLNQDFHEHNLRNFDNIIFHLPMQQSELHKILAQFDIGLALDIPVDRNRDLAITNKLLAYLQAGLYVIATETSAQKDFLNDWQHHGTTFNYTINNFQSIVEDIIDKIDIIRKEKDARFKAFNNNNWETASIQLLNQWNN